MVHRRSLSSKQVCRTSATTLAQITDHGSRITDYGLRITDHDLPSAECDSLDEGEFPIGTIIEKHADPVLEFAGDGEIDLVVFAIGITDGP